MKLEKTGLKAISRLVVVSKDFSTYYIPGTTIIIDKRVAQIEEIGEDYHMLDIDGQVISKVSKKAPCIVDYSEVYEDVLDPELESYLINFGNYLLRDRGVDKEVSDADLANWKDSLEK